MPDTLPIQISTDVGLVAEAVKEIAITTRVMWPDYSPDQKKEICTFYARMAKSANSVGDAWDAFWADVFKK